MTYQEYLTKLDELFKLEYKLICINADEVIEYAALFISISKQSKDQKIQETELIYENLIYKYEEVLAKQFDEIDKNTLSIKQTLFVMKKLIDLLYASIICLQIMVKPIERKLKQTTRYKSFVKALTHYEQVYKKVDLLTKKLNITYSDDFSDMQFGLNLIVDKDINAIDFSKVLIPSK